jgi:hypothetical protein
MTDTKKLLIEVAVENTASVKKELDEIRAQLQAVRDSHAEITKITATNAEAVIATYEKINTSATGHHDALVAEAKQYTTITEAVEGQVKAEKELAKNAKSREAAVTKFMTSAKEMTSEGTKLIRAVGLATAASEEDKEAMLQRLAGFEAIVQGIQGMTGALAKGREMWIAYNAVMAKGGLGLKDITTMFGGAGMALGAAGAVGGMYGAYSGLQMGGGQGAWGTLKSGLGGVSTNRGGVSSVGDMQTGGWLMPQTWGITAESQRGSLDMFGRGSMIDRMRDERSQGAMARQLSGQDKTRRLRDTRYGMQGGMAGRMMQFASQEDLFKEGGLRDQRRGELTAQYEEQKSRTNLESAGGVADYANIRMKELDVLIEKEHDKHKLELSHKEKAIEMEQKQLQQLMKRHAELSKIHQAEMTGAERFVALNDEDRKLANESLQRLSDGGANLEDVQRTQGMRTEEQEKAAQEIIAKEAGAAGYFDAIGTSLEDVLGRMEELGNLEIKLQTSSETIVKLEGEWNQLAASVGEKVQTAMQSKYDEIMREIDDHMNNLAGKNGTPMQRTPQGKSPETIPAGTAPADAAPAKRTPSAPVRLPAPVIPGAPARQHGAPAVQKAPPKAPPAPKPSKIDTPFGGF